MPQSEQQFLNDLDKQLWTSADKLRSNLDAAVYKHAVLGLIFLKYVSDSFNGRRKELIGQFKTKNHEYFIDPADYDSPAEYEKELEQELEIRDYYTEKNVFWVPEQARWNILQDNASRPIGSVLKFKNGESAKLEKQIKKNLASIGWSI